MKFSFDKDKHREKMKPHVDKLVKWLYDNYGITFKPTDGELENVIFTNSDNRVKKISHRCFYRFSGMCTIHKVKPNSKNNEVEFVDVSDDMFINSYMKSIILEIFEIEE